jgi:4a-hydroxytetrahydrobiopterin dehydratase
MTNTSWSENKNKLEKKFQFNKYQDVMTFVNQVMQIANNQNHHPEISVHFNFVTVLITDYEKGGVSEKCHRFISEVDRITVANSLH